MATAIRLLSLCPRLTKRKDRLVASTPWRLRVLTLGLFLRWVIIDPKQGVIILRRRYFWFFGRGWRIPFDAVAAVTYAYQDWGDSGGWSWAHDTFDIFRVGLRLQSGKERHLFTFLGDGTFRNDGPLPDWFYWAEYAFDTSGTQEKESRAYVERLSKLIGAPVEAGR